VPNTLRKLAVLVLLLVLPLQGVAAALSHMLCPPAASSQHLDPSHGHAVDGAGHSEDGTDSDTDYGGHLACHLSLSGIPSLSVVVAPRNPPAFETPDALSRAPLFPEQPQRVPLA